MKKQAGLIYLLVLIVLLIVHCEGTEIQDIETPPRNDQNRIEETSREIKATPTVVSDGPLVQQISLIEEDLASLKSLVDISEINSDILVDLKYSTENNFLHADLYGDLDRCFLQEKVAYMLSNAQEILTAIKPGYRLIVFDCLRPRSVQSRMWSRVKGTVKEFYVANPQKGSMHNYGAAVDVSMVDEKGNLVDMGTAFDEFEELSQPKRERRFLESGELSSEQAANRLLLRMVMVQAGFLWIDSEWWHFNADTKENIRRKYRIVE